MNADLTDGLKEWAAAIHALLDGRQTILLRKGGIHEKRFTVAAQEFLLFPTVAHSHAERVRPEHRDLLAASASDSTEDHVTVRAAAKVFDVISVEIPERLDDIADLHIWTHESVRADRVDFRPRHRLTILVTQVFPLVAPVLLPRVPEYRGCASWVTLPPTPHRDERVHDDDHLAAIADRVRATVG